LQFIVPCPDAVIWTLLATVGPLIIGLLLIVWVIWKG
jgi:hypothetical protein